MENYYFSFEFFIHVDDACNFDTKQPHLSKPINVTHFDYYMIKIKWKCFLQLMRAAPALEATHEI